MKLIDAVIRQDGAGTWPWPQDSKAFTRAARSAAHFEVDEEVASAALAIAHSNTDQLLAARRFIRTPFPRMWIEWSDKATNHLLGGGIGDRVGVLIDTENDGQFGIIHVVHTIPNRTALVPMIYAFDYRDSFVVRQGLRDVAIYFDHITQSRLYYEEKFGVGIKAKSKSSDQAEWEKSRRSCLGWSNYLSDQVDELRRRIHARQGEAWSGAGLLATAVLPVARFVESLLICMNSRNLVEIGDAPDLFRLNRARAKSGKAPFAAVRPIRLSLSKIARRKFDAACAAGGGDVNRHWVMGHYKIRKSGVFWWSPFVRGNVGDAPSPPKPHILTGGSKQIGEIAA